MRYVAETTSYSQYYAISFMRLVYVACNIYNERIKLADLNLAVILETAKPSNLNPRQMFRLYGIYIREVRTHLHLTKGEISP